MGSVSGTVHEDNANVPVDVHTDFRIFLFTSIIIISSFKNSRFFFSMSRTLSGIQRLKLFLNIREKHFDTCGTVAKVLISTNVQTAVCDMLNEMANILEVMIFVLQERLTVSGDQDPYLIRRPI